MPRRIVHCHEQIAKFLSLAQAQISELCIVYGKFIIRNKRFRLDKTLHNSNTKIEDKIL